VPAPELEQLVRAARCVFTSPLRRSRESAALLAPGTTPLVDPDFRETELPSGFRSRVRLTPELWGLIARSAWFCGWSAGVETSTAARGRAAKAAALLTARAARDDVVALVGHGMMNILIARHLRAAGWRGPRLPSQKHWGFGVYERNDP
jgi:broad specificity phosphatase PhoE